MAAITKPKERFTEAELDDEIVIMRLDDGEFFGLSGTAAAAWRLIDGKRDRAALVDALAREYSTDQADITTDVDEFLAELKEAGLLADE